MKMLYYTREWVRRFYPPDNGASSGAAGNGGNPASNQQQQQQTPPDPFAGIDVDSLDAESRAALERAKTEFATLQTRTTGYEQSIRQHQSERDKAQAELRRVRETVTGPTDHGQPKMQTTEDRVFAQLIADGLDAAAARPQAQTMAKILDAERAQLQQQLGQQFAPVAAIALQSDAQQSFSAAMATDHFGWTQVPEVCELVWQGALQLAQNGQQADVQTIKNLAAMHYITYTEKNPQVFATLQNGGNQPNNGMIQPSVPPTIPFRQPNIATGFSYPGAHFAGRQVQTQPNNGARTVMDAPTTAAMNAVNQQWKNMGLNPKG